MASAVNRPAIFLNLASFVVVSIFCISTGAPIMQQDILLRCQEMLAIHRIPSRGLSVNGRDVTLSGSSQSAITSPGARSAIAGVPGVRVVTIRVSAVEPNPASPKQEVQEKIDRLLKSQGIAFKAGTTALTPESESALDKIASYLSQASSLQCEIRGYDSPAPEIRSDLVLALQRALATEDYLETRGIADGRLSTHAVHAAEGRRTDGSVDLIVRTRD